ncbi:PREDICTED: rRNA biogenesis protein RRP36-like isoform X2 [Erythranthe guttata]|uniref:rRNA biogenesis protein RRP36-like isoform X2 n=1 Tax=Erythranthe guttata TaxID=4155 RepID=UPI00064D842A|nr:PREDICTED: rRNA biogenesis protein RRP36-like isoform X2 [Erythranthe guttata]|eukprot:XP_012842727.1 PREDICTED: rRNA biogenesis protein RRP36-like isoform X2 [Erythranthe guttata]
MNKLCTVTIWLNGKFVHTPKLAYVGGKMEVVDRICLDYMNLDNLFQIYRMSGGEKTNIQFYFVYPGLSLHDGLRMIEDDISIQFLVSAHEDLDHLTLYTEENDREPLIAIDVNGNVIVDKGETLLLKYSEGNTRETVETVNIEDDAPMDEYGTQMNEDEAPLNEEEALDENERTMTEEEATLNQEEENETPITEDEAALNQEPLNQEEAPMNEEEATLNEEEASLNEDEPVNKEDAAIFEDDSSDEDYVQSDNEDGDDDIPSDAPSEEFADIEGSSEDDIFLDRNSSKKDLARKLRQMLNKEKRSVQRYKKCRVNPSQQTTDWYSDVDDEDDIENLNFLDSERRRVPSFSEGETMKNRNLEVGMKFPNVDIYRKALIDWVVRNGYELEYLKNERTRVTATCKEEACKWRIHASVVQGSQMFQVLCFLLVYVSSLFSFDPNDINEFICYVCRLRP